MFLLLRLRLSLLWLGPDVLKPTYRTLLHSFLFFFFTLVRVQLLLKRIQISLTLSRRWPRIPSDASKRSYEKTQDCCRIPLTLRINALGCLEVSWTVMLLFCCKLCYTKWYSILSYFRKLDVTRYHKCSTFSKTGRAISGIGHTPFDVILLVSTWQRVVSKVRPSPFFLTP